VVVGQDLPIATARREDTAPIVANGDDRLKFSGSACSGRAKGNEFGTRSTVEMKEIDPSVKFSADVTHGCADRVHKAISVSVDDGPCVLDQLEVLGCQDAQISSHLIESRPDGNAPHPTRCSH